MAPQRNKGRPRLQWIDNINEDIESTGLMLRGAMDLTKDRIQSINQSNLHLLEKKNPLMGFLLYMGCTIEIKKYIK